MKCKGCGSGKISHGICTYCNTKQIENKTVMKKITSNMGNFKALYNTELIGNMNDVGYAENCIIRGNMNDIVSSKNIEVIGNMNDY